MALTLNKDYYAVVDPNGDFVVRQASPGVYESEKAANDKRNGLIKLANHRIKLSEGYSDESWKKKAAEEFSYILSTKVKKLKFIVVEE